MNSVLIIEDDLLWQCKLQIIAERAKLKTIHIATNLTEAEQVLENHKIDLIIADIHLEKENTFSLLTSKAHREIPTILTTASETREDFSMSKKLMNSVFLVKPLHHHSLLSAIHFLKKNTINVPNNIPIEDDLKISPVEIKRFYKLLGNDNIIDLFKLNKIESYILKQRWNELKTFATIGKNLNISGQRIQRMYEKIIDKISVKTLSNVLKYQEYLEITKHKKNRLEILRNSIEIRKEVDNRFELKIGIGNLENLNTKWKNVLLDKNIKTVEDLVQYSKKELLMFKKLGPFAVLEIEKAIAEKGFRIKD